MQMTQPLSEEVQLSSSRVILSGLVNVPILAGRRGQTSDRTACRLAKMCSVGMSSCAQETGTDDMNFYCSPQSRYI